MTKFRPIEWAEWLGNGVTCAHIALIRESEKAAIEELIAKHAISGKSADEIAVRTAALNGRINAFRDILAGLEDLAQENGHGQD